MAQMKEQIKAPEKIQLSNEEIANLDAQPKLSRRKEIIKIIAEINEM